MNVTPEKKLYQIAESQLGYFTAKQAISAGYLPKNHTYHVSKGHWVRELRSIYRLANFPHTNEGEMVLWSLWSRNRNELPEGVYSHETALSLYDISDIMPAKLHMTVPIGFRRTIEIPAVLILHRAQLAKEDIQKKTGYSVTTPFRTILDIAHSRSTSEEIIAQAIGEFRIKGFLTENELVKLVETEPSLAKYIIGSQWNSR